MIGLTGHDDVALYGCWHVLGVELDYLPCVQMSCFSHVWTPYPNKGVWGGFPPTTAIRGSEGVTTIVRAPPGGGLGAAPPKGIFYEKCLVKYCNFVVNLDHSLCRRSDSRSHVYLRVFFSLEGNPLLYMRELYYDCVLFWETRLWESEEKVTTDLL